MDKRYTNIYNYTTIIKILIDYEILCYISHSRKKSENIFKILKIILHISIIKFAKK